MENNIVTLPGKIKVFLVEGAITQTINKTWSELKSLRDNSQLIPGLWYRITDYTCTTSEFDTQSAGHVFDIIVRADDKAVLNENAYAAKHDGDTYFANNKLESWELKYCLDNDTTRFVWANTTNGKGVIYYMKDEANNECGYDFKNIQYRLYKTTDTNGIFNGYWAIDTTDLLFPSTVTIDESDYIYAYTFSIIDENDNIHDLTLSPFVEIDGSIANNIIKSYVDYGEGKFKLNHIVFRGSSEFGTYSNIIESNCCYLTFGEIYSNNHFNSGIEFSSFGSYFTNNHFEGAFYSNSIGNNCSYNHFESDFQYNSIGNYCSNNYFGNYYINNSIGNYCSYNHFGNNCQNNLIGNNCSNNHFGDFCSNIIFSKSYCKFIIVENGNLSITLTSNQTTSNSNLLRNITIAQGVNNNTSITKTISHNTVNDTFQTEYKPANSQVILV